MRLGLRSALLLTDAVLVHLEAGTKALEAVFSSKLSVKGKHLTELLQPHSTGMRTL